MSRERLLNVAQLPSTLWKAATGTIILPEMLSRAYVTRVDRLALRELGTSRPSGGGAVGGATLEATNQHFAQAFDGSAARAILAILDPKNEVGPTSDHFIQSTAGARLALIDAPCGAGAAALAFLSTLAELRATGVLPRMPLEVCFIGGEFSQHAADHACALFSATVDALAEQAIFVDPVFKHWDVMDQISTTDFVKTCLDHGRQCPAKLLVVANFNGLLIKDRRQAEAQPQLNELFRYASGDGSLAVWIEPDMNRATSGGGLFPWLTTLFEKGWRIFGRALTSGATGQPAFTSEAAFQLPLQPGRTGRVTLAVLPIDLARPAK